MAAIVGLGSSAVHERVKRLEQRGYVKGYGARLDAQRLGIELVAFVSVYTQYDVQYDAFHSTIAALPEVSEVYSVAGEESFLLKVSTRSTAHLDDFLTRLKSIAGIARSKTTIVLSTPFERNGIALDELVGERAPALRAVGAR